MMVRFLARNTARTLFTILVAFLVAVAVGCGSPSDSPSNPPPTTTAEACPPGYEEVELSDGMLWEADSHYECVEVLYSQDELDEAIEAARSESP